MNAREFKGTNDYFFVRSTQAIETFAEAYAEHKTAELQDSLLWAKGMLDELLKDANEQDAFVKLAKENESLKKQIEELKACKEIKATVSTDEDGAMLLTVEDAEPEKVCKNCKHWGDGDRMPISNSKQYCGKTNMHTYGSMSCPDHKPIEVVE